MKVSEKLTKTEALLLALTLVFLICTGVVYALRMTGGQEADYVIRTEGVAPENAAAPETESGEETELPEPTPTAEAPLDINTATEAQLCLLPGIGEVLAGRIVAYREENGPFTEPAEIMNVSGIGEGIYGEIQDVITVGEAAE